MRNKEAEETKRILLDSILLAINKVINDEHIEWDYTAVVVESLSKSFERIYKLK